MESNAQTTQSVKTTKRGGCSAAPTLLGVVEPDPAGEILGTGYMRFQSPNGLGGLAKWTNDRLDLLAVHAFVEGRGMFRDFIAAAKQQWNTVCVWEDWNPIVGAALARYGFSRETEIQGDGEVIRGWRWDKTPNGATPSADPRQGVTSDAVAGSALAEAGREDR